MSGLGNPVRKQEVMLTQCSAAVMPARHSVFLLWRRKSDYSRERKKEKKKTLLKLNFQKINMSSKVIGRPVESRAILAEI